MYTSQFVYSSRESEIHPTVRKSRMVLVGYRRLATEAVQGAALALERVDDIHGGDGLVARALGVGHGVADDALEEDFHA